MSSATPYRTPPKTEARTVEPTLVVVWKDSTRDTRSKVALRGYYLLMLEVFVLSVVAIELPEVAIGCALALAVYHGVRRARQVDPGFTLDVHDGALTITRAGQPEPAVLALSAVRDVEVERKGIERATDKQRFGPVTAPTELTGARDVARIVVVLDEPDAPVRLTDEYAPVFMCMEQFGKVRTFLRRHGWKPIGERDEAPPVPSPHTVVATPPR